MTLRTYGDKPLSFQLEENGEYYYVGSEVNDEKKSNFLDHFQKLIHIFNDLLNKIFVFHFISGGKLFTVIPWFIV